MARPGLLCAPPACQHCSPALLLHWPWGVHPKKGWTANFFSCVSKLTQTVNRVQGKVCERLSFGALVPKMWVQNSLCHQTRTLHRVLCCFRAAAAGCPSVSWWNRGVFSHLSLQWQTRMALRRALHILFKRRSEILDVFISLPVEGG